MNIIEELVKKYQGTYSEEKEKIVSSPNGQYRFQAKQGLIIMDGTKISINIKAVGGAVPTAEPYRIILHLKKEYPIKLQIFLKSNLQRIIEAIFTKRDITVLGLCEKRFSFKGGQKLINELKSSLEFCELIKDEKLYILIRSKKPKQIILTPSHGIDGVDHFEKLLLILKRIEAKIEGRYL